MKWRDIFMSAQQRQNKCWEEETKIARAYDQGKQMGDIFGNLIKQFYDTRDVPLCKDLCNIYRQRMLMTHTAGDAEVTQEYLSFLDEINRIRAEMPADVYHAIGEWKYTIIKMGMKDDYDRLIASKIETITTVIKEVASTEMMLAAARVRGKLTAAEYAMGPEEFQRHRERVQAGSAQETPSIH